MFFTRRPASRQRFARVSKVNRDRRRKLFFESLEDRRVLATLEILSLTTNNASLAEHNGVTGDDRGGIAISPTHVFYTGDGGTGAFPVNSMGSGVNVGGPKDAIFSDIGSGVVYSLGTSPTTILPNGGGTITHLLELDGATSALTGNAVALSTPVSVFGGTGIFAGNEKVVLWYSGTATAIDTTTGIVTTLGTVSISMNGTENWAQWGVAEEFGGDDYLTYLNGSNVLRTRISDGATSTVASFPGGLSDMAVFTVSESLQRWYFHYEGNSGAFGFGSDETIGYADAVIQTFPGNFTNVTPDPRTEPVPFVDVTFDNPINASTFDYNDLSLTLNAGPDLITPAVTVTSLGGNSYRIGNLAGLTIADGTYRLTVESAGINDSLGFPLEGNGSERWITRHALAPLVAVAPLGSLIYDPAETRALPAVTDVQNLQIALDAGQKFSVVITPSGTLQPAVNVTNPASVSIGTATAGGAGQEVVLRNLSASSAGTYQISVATAGGTTGTFTIQVFLNADVEAEEHGGPANDTIGSAQNIDASFINLTPGGAQRGAVVGHAGRGLFDVDRNSGLLRQIDGSTGATVGVISMSVSGNPVSAAYGIAVDPTTDLVYALVSYSGVNTALVTLNVGTGVGTPIADVNSTGQRFTDIAFDSAGTLYGLTGDSGSNSNSLFAINKVNGVRTFLVALTNNGTGTGESLAFNPDTGLLYRFQAGVFNSIDPNNSFAVANIPVTGSNPYQAQALTYVGGGQFRLARFAQLYSLSTTGFAAVLGNLESTASRIHGLALVGGETVDVYSFNLTANQTTTLAVQRANSTQGSYSNFDSTVELLNSAGTVLATGVTTANLSSVISDFTAPITGIYYARVTRTLSVGDYSLVVTRNAAFDTESNHEDTPQPIGSVNTILGHVHGGTPFGTLSTALYAVAGVQGAPSILYELDPTNGQIIQTIGPIGFTNVKSLDFDPTSGILYGHADGVGLLSIDPDTGVGTVIGNDGQRYTNISFDSNGTLYASSITHQNPGIWTINPLTGAGTQLFNFGDRHRYAVSVDENNQLWLRDDNSLYTINPPAVNFVTNITGFTGGTFYRAGEFHPDNGLYYDVTLSNGNSGPATLHSINPVTGVATPLGTAPIGISALTFGGGNTGDFYSFSGTAGGVIEWESSTPSDGPFQFANGLDPYLELFDPLGNLVAFNDNGAVDGKNAIINHVALATGTYTLRVFGTGNTRGEYVLTREPSGSLAAAISGGALTVTDISPGGEVNDLLVHVVGANLVITDANEQFTPTSAAATGGTLSNGDRTLTIPLVNITGTASILTMGGNDLITVDYAGGPFGKALVILGGTHGPQGDKLVIKNPSTAFPFVVDTNGGKVDASNDPTLTFSEIEQVCLFDPSLRDLPVGQFYARGTSGPDYVLFMSSGQVDPSFRLRIGNAYFPRSGGNYGPYATAGANPVAHVFGRGGNDTISMYNTRLNGALYGEDGDDILTGGYGNDLLVGGAGNDRINGGTVGGHDTIWGDDFNPATDNPAVASQTLLGGNDQINTYGGNDTIYGQGGNDIINSGAGDDYINGGAGVDTIDGQGGNDRIYGGEGNDVISGSDGNDLIAGNDGNDTLNGRTGNDILIGGLGKDILNGHEGGDALVGDESNGAGSKSLAKGDAVDVALTALLLAWGTTPTLGSLGGFNSAGADGSEDTLYGGGAADAFFGLVLLLDKAPDRVFPGQDLN